MCMYLQVKFEGDPEGALVSYSSNAEALACYKCPDPVFNNRFIKVFWHNKKDNSQVGCLAMTAHVTTLDFSGLYLKFCKSE